MRDGEPQVYTALATLRNGYMQTQWARVQMFLVFNTVALPLVFGINSPDQVKMFISFVGFGMHGVILQSTLRADSWIKYLDARMIELEQLDQKGAHSIRVLVFSHADFARKRHSWVASRRTFGLFGLAISVIWVLQSLHYIRQLLG